MSEQPRAIDGTDFELCEFNDQCESCLHYGPIYFGNKDYWDPREGHYHCEECVRGIHSFLAAPPSPTMPP